MIIDFSEYLGQVKNDTGIWGKAFIFKCIENKENIPYTFEAILFVHETLPAFLSVADEDIEYKSEILKLIFEKYTLKQLLEAEYEN